MDRFDEMILTIITALPFAAALALLLWPGEKPKHWKYFSLLVAVASAVLSLYVLLQYNQHFGGADEKYQFVNQWDWLPSLGISFHVGVDGISAVMIFMTGIVYVGAMLMTWSTDSRVRDYLILLHVLTGGVYGTFVSVDLFFLFFFYEIAVLPMFLLIAFWGSSSENLRVFFAGWRTNFSRTKEYGAMKLVIFLVAGSIAIWIAILAIYVESGAQSFDLIELQKTQYGDVFARVFFPFLMLGFGLLAGLWPLHTWSPDGHVAAPTSVSMLHAGVLMKLGAYGIIRVGVEVLPNGADDWGIILVILGTVNIVYGAVSALSQRDLKYMIGYSSVSHMGYVMVGIGTLSSIGMSGAVLQMFAHGVMTALFFTLVGFIYEKSHSRSFGSDGEVESGDSINALNGLAKVMPVGSFMFAIAGLASLGLPGLSGFVPELLVFIGLFQTYPWAGVLAVVGAAITAIYILRLMAMVFFGEPDDRWAGLPDIAMPQKITGVILIASMFTIGLVPFYFLELIDSSVELMGAIGG